MPETKENMKITKFKVMIEETHKYLENEKQGNTYALLSYYPTFIDKYIENEYVQVIRTQLMCTPSEIKQCAGTLKVVNNELEYIHLNSPFIDIMSVGTLIRNDDGELSEAIPLLSLDRNILIFWLLFLAAIDENLYNNELSSIVDFAYCLKFDEPMIRDWCNAVKYVLEGNHLNENCDLQCVTDSGKEFFLHRARPAMRSPFFSFINA